MTPPSPSRAGATAAVTLAVVALVPLLAGCTGPGGGPDVAVLVAEHRVAPGEQAAFPIQIAGLSNASDPPEVTVAVAAGMDVTISDPLPTDNASIMGLWVTVGVPETAEPGRVEVRVRISPGPGLQETEAPLVVHVAPPERTVQRGQTAMVKFTGRIPGQGLVTTNVGPLANASMPRADAYQPPQGDGAFEPVALTAGGQGGPVAGLRQSLVGAGVDRSFTVTLSPGEAFGNATIPDTRPREESIDRNVSQQRTFEGPIQAFGRLLSPSAGEGDVIQAPFGDDTLPYRITHRNQTHAAVELNVTVGDTFSRHGAWQNGTQVVEVNASVVRFRETPTTGSGETFTYYPYWPDSTEVVEVTNDTIRVRHTPDVGTTYPRQVRQQTIQVEVVDVGPAEITVERDNPHPLAGETVVFDVTVVDVQTPQGGMGVGGR